MLLLAFREKNKAAVPPSSMNHHQVQHSRTLCWKISICLHIFSRGGLGLHPSQVNFCQFAGLRGGVSCFVSPVINWEINISTEQSFLPFLPPFPLSPDAGPTFPSTPTLPNSPWSCREEQHLWSCLKGLLPTSTCALQDTGVSQFQDRLLRARMPVIVSLL